jgi:hypothetical protein
MKRNLLFSCLFILMAGCAAPVVPTASEESSTVSVEVTSLPELAITPTAAPSPSQTQSGNEYFSELLPSTLEECIRENVLRSDTPEHFLADLESLREKELAAMNSNSEYFPVYGVSIATRPTNERLGMTRLYFDNPQISSCSYVDFGQGREFLILGFYLNSYWNETWNIPEFRYPMPIHFALDLNLQQNIPEGLFPPSQLTNISLFSNDEKIYQDLINKEISGNIFLHGVYPTIGRVLSDNSIDKNLEWLFNYQYVLSNKFSLSDQMLFSHSISGIPSEDLILVQEWAAHYIFPVEFIDIKG